MKVRKEKKSESSKAILELGGSEWPVGHVMLCTAVRVRCLPCLLLPVTFLVSLCTASEGHFVITTFEYLKDWFAYMYFMCHSVL